MLWSPPNPPGGWQNIFFVDENTKKAKFAQMIRVTFENEDLVENGKHTSPIYLLYSFSSSSAENNISNSHLTCP